MAFRVTLLLLLVRIGCVWGKELLKGISYGPAPLKAAGKMPNDDFMSPSAKALWGPSGRGDLEIMKKIGANAVRLYGNDPRENHKPFLDEAAKQGLEVIPGMSDYPYIQMPKNCQTTDFDCYSQIKEQYVSILQNGFVDNGAYHPALKTMIVINEPDLKIPGISKPKEFCRAIVSAIDGMLDAEKETGVKSNLVNFTATFSFGMCTACDATKPALGQMLELRKAMLDPETVGYTAKNDLAEVYRTRYTNSFNTNNPAGDMKPLFLDAYEASNFSTPVFIGEYHSTHVDTKKDLKEVMDLATKSNSLVGVSFFEFQVRYDKGGSEMLFGMFGLGAQEITTMRFFGVEFPVWCLMKIADKKSASGETVVDGLAEAFGGPGIKSNELCVIDPEKVPLSEDGYQAILSLKSVAKMAAFVARVVQHMGGVVKDKKALEKFASKYAGQSIEVVARRLGELSFAAMTDELGQRPSWVTWDAMAACVADRAADDGTVGEAIGYACGQLAPFNCSDLPTFCQDHWGQADYVFSLYYGRKVKGSDPLHDCNFNGAAMFAPTTVYHAADSKCVVTKDPATTALSEEGYQTILEAHDVGQVATFIQREVEDLNMKVTNTSALELFAKDPPKHFADLKEQLSQFPWVCGGPSGRNCPGKPSPGVSGLEIGFIICIVLLILFVAAVYVRRKRLAAREVQQPLNEV